MKVLVVAGARPNFIKVAPILRTLSAAGHNAILVHTGQHYDYAMSGTFFDDLKIPEPDYYLEVGSGSHSEQTGRCVLAFEPVVQEERPDWVVVVGDVNSTLACALVTAKLREDIGCRLAHVEAGLRSGDWSMPEEINRVLTDQIADLCLTPSPDADDNLRAEGIPEERIVFVGNVMVDTLFHQLPKARACTLREELGLELGGYAVATLHRPSNVDDAGRLSEIVEGLCLIGREVPLVLPLHPRTAERLDAFGLRNSLNGVTCLDPLGYTEMLSLVMGSAVVLTDSGGLQEETTVLGVPCVTLRQSTERPITVEQGTNRLVDWPPTSQLIMAAANVKGARRKARQRRIQLVGWDGRTANRTLSALTAGLA